MPRSRKSRSRKSRSGKRSHRKSRSGKKRSQRSRTSRSGGKTAYCVVCHKKVHLKNTKVKILKNGRRALVGQCPYSGNKVYKFVKNK